MSLRITIACPEAHIADSNQLALCVGNTEADIYTFRDSRWEDGDGNRFALASLLASEDFPTLASQPLVAPAHAPDVDLVAAGRAQMKLSIWPPYSEGPFPSTNVDELLAVIGLEPGLTLPLLNLSPIATIDPA